MITAADADFHPRNPQDRTWTETTVLVFSVPEAGILGNAYVLARPNLGVVLSSVVVGSGFCRQPYEIDFTDPQMHLPCPPSFSNYSLENGLSLEVKDAPTNDIHVRYEHALGSCRFDLTFQGLHNPFDMHDPSQNPLAETGSKQATGRDERIGDEWENGHFEVIGHVTGELELRGKSYEVDCFDVMDHSWGPRTEIGTRAVSWANITLDENFGMHLGILLDIKNGEVVYEQLRKGFVFDHGEVRGLVEAEMEATRMEMLGTSNRIWAKDVAGNEYEFFGTALGGYAWHTFNPCHVCYQGVYRYEHDGKVGYAEVGDIFGIEYLGERLSRHGRKG